jgi:hypothetical protein
LPCVQLGGLQAAEPGAPPLSPPLRYEGITQKLKWNQAIREPPPPSTYDAEVMAAQQRHEATWAQDSGYH